MANYISNNQRQLKVGISSFSENKTSLEVIGRTELDDLSVSGVSTFTGTADFNGSIDVIGQTELDELSKKYSQYGTFGSSKIRVSNIAFGQLASQTQLDKSTNNKISLLEAGKLVKWVIDSPRSYNLHYMALDPIQRDL